MGWDLALRTQGRPNPEFVLCKVLTLGAVVHPSLAQHPHPSARGSCQHGPQWGVPQRLVSCTAFVKNVAKHGTEVWTLLEGRCSSLCRLQAALVPPPLWPTYTCRSPDVSGAGFHVNLPNEPRKFPPVEPSLATLVAPVEGHRVPTFSAL